jgi:hypothetical protein
MAQSLTLLGHLEHAVFLLLEGCGTLAKSGLLGLGDRLLGGLVVRLLAFRIRCVHLSVSRGGLGSLGHGVPLVLGFRRPVPFLRRGV